MSEESSVEESLASFVRRKIHADRDRDAEARARRELVDSLVGRKPAPIEIGFSGSVVGAPKKPARGIRSNELRSTVKDVVEYRADSPPEVAMSDPDTEPVVLAVMETPPAVVEAPRRARKTIAKTNATKTETKAVHRIDESKKRTRAEDKLREIALVASAAGADRNLSAHELISAVAHLLGVSEAAVRTFYTRTLSKEQRAYLRFGDRGTQITRSQQKFAIIVKLRAEIRDSGKVAPTKSEFIPLAAERLGMTHFSTSTYIYERLTDAQKRQLEFGTPTNDSGYTLDEQIGILKIARKEFKDKGLPPPRHIDLANAAAKRLNMKVDSVRTLIVSLSDATKEELELLGSRSNKLGGMSSFHVREGFMGGLAVLRLRKLDLTISNLQKVLQLKRSLMNSILKEYPDIKLQLIHEKPEQL